MAWHRGAIPRQPRVSRSPARVDAKLRVFTQDDLSIGDYCAKMKSMADLLGDLGEVVHDCTLVLNVLRGLNERYVHMRVHFRRFNLFPCFHDVRNDLLLEELSIGAPSPAPLPPSSPRRRRVPPLAGLRRVCDDLLSRRAHLI
jgi:hypothetical protein